MEKITPHSHHLSHIPAKQRYSKADGVTPWLRGLKNHNGFGTRELPQVSKAARGDPGACLCHQLCKSRAAFGSRGTGSTEPQNSHWLTATHQAVIAILLPPAKRAFSSHPVLRKIAWLERAGLESWLAGSCQRARLTHCSSLNRQHQNTNKLLQDLSTHLSAAGKAAHRSPSSPPH